MEITNPVFQFGSIQEGGWEGHKAHPGEVRWGPWGQLWGDGFGGRAEGGLCAQVYLFGHRRHGTFDVRFGGGYGEDMAGKVPHMTVTLAGGPRWVEGVPWHETIDSDDGQPRTPQLLGGFRFFLSGRRTMEPVAQYWVTGGVEMELGFTARD